jgi:EmrB/QacA subfamily drug resistance transporter
VIIVDETVLNVVVPTLFRDLDASSREVQWAIDAYVVVYAALLFPAGNLGDRYGRRTFLLVGLAVFAAGSGWAAWAPSALVLVAARTVMAVGGALIMPQTLSILVEVFPARQRAQAIGLWSAVSGIAIVAGPIVGGWLIEHFWWGSVFLVNLPIVVVTVAGTLVLLPNHRDPDASPADVPGTVLAVVAMLGVLSGIIESNVPAGLVGVAAWLAFVLVERRVPSPMLDLTVIRHRVVAACLVIVAVVFGALQGTGYVLTQYLQLVQGRSPMATGMVYAPTTIGWSLAAVASPWFVRRFGHRLVLSASVAVIALGYLALATRGADHALALILVVFAVQGVAMGLSITPVTDLIMGALPTERAGVASALNDVSRQVGGAVGVAVLGSLLSFVFVRRVPTLDNLAQAPGSSLARAGFVSGYRWVMLVSTAVVLLGVVAAWLGTSSDAGAA